MATDHVRPDTAPFFRNETDTSPWIELLWGDRVETLETSGERTKVRARGRTGWVRTADLGGASLLEVYFIDVGQGDGILIRTPDHRHVMIDGGYSRSKQPTRKNAADFVDWKFVKDYGGSAIELEALIASHNDADHYGGLWDLLNAAESRELDAAEVRVENVFHAGVGWWRKGSDRWLGPKVKVGNEWFLTQLVGDRAAVEAALANGAEPALQGEWAKFLRTATEARTRGGSATPIRRLSNQDGFVPGFAPASGQPSLKILAPIERSVADAPALRSLGGDSINTNGNSLLLRLDYGRARILLTGDLNEESQRYLLERYTGQRQELECDVAKACHHGSDKVSYTFLQALRAGATVICSGDNEGHDHPRPDIVAASATTGYLQIQDDKILTPLVYSTELARSLCIGHPTSAVAHDKSTGQELTLQREDFAGSKIVFEETMAGELQPKTGERTFDRTMLITKVIYGLVNVRTDGERILCATMNEQDQSWQVKTFVSRF